MTVLISHIRFSVFAFCELKASSTIGLLCLSIQVWAQQLPTGQECRALDTVQGNRGQVSDTPPHTQTQTQSSSSSVYISVPFCVCTCAPQWAVTHCWIRSRKLQRQWPVPSFLQLSTRASVSMTTITGPQLRRLHPQRWPCLRVPITYLLVDQKVRHCCCDGNVGLSQICLMQCMDH